jgi:cell division protein FtsL
MNANGNRRMELEATTYQLRQNLEAIESKIREQKRQLDKLNV